MLYWICITIFINIQMPLIILIISKYLIEKKSHTYFERFSFAFEMECRHNIIYFTKFLWSYFGTIDWFVTVLYTMRVCRVVASWGQIQEASTYFILYSLPLYLLIVHLTKNYQVCATECRARLFFIETCPCVRHDNPCTDCRRIDR